MIDLFYNKYSLNKISSQKKDVLSMSASNKPMFRADHVGSLLRPKSITDAFKKFVKSYSPCKIQHGGLGAFYVKLKSKE